MPVETYLAYLATVGIFFATPPGPSQLLMIANSMTHGLRPSLATAAGDLSANALQMTAAAFGLAAVLATSSEALQVVKWAGVAYLVYVGIRTFRSTSPVLRTAAGVDGARLYRQGFFTSAANPKAVFFFAALFPQFIDSDLAIWPQLLILGATYIAVDGTILVIYGSASARVAGQFRGGFMRSLNRVSGVLMIAAAALLAFKDVDAAPNR